MLDINEVAPEFSTTEYSATVLSIAPPGTSLLQVFARDDDGEDNVISYSVINEEENGLNFTVDSDGVIRNDASFPAVTADDPPGVRSNNHYKRVERVANISE